MKKYPYILIGMVLCIVLEYALYQLNHRYEFFTPFFTTPGRFSSEKHLGDGHFTNPLLECITDETGGTARDLNISKSELTGYIQSIIQSGKVSDMSVYMRDLNNGPWLGVNEEEDFLGSSLLKVPVLISYLHEAEDNPDILQKKIAYTKKTIDDNQYWNASKDIVVGQTYTVEELLGYMIDYSDNNATQLLVGNLPPSELAATFSAFGLPQPSADQPYPVDVKAYASFFRVLFNASYLDEEHSEKALSILSRTEFDKGLNALLPSSVVISHKFGIRSDDDGLEQLHDCGIVYYPGHPYLLCIMSSGKDFDSMADSIAKVSRFVYDQVDKIATSTAAAGIDAHL
jgi:beta-lactamase class A